MIILLIVLTLIDGHIQIALTRYPTEDECLQALPAAQLARPAATVGCVRVVEDKPV